MTREDAIDIINSCVQADTEEANEALDMAIKALEEEQKRICVKDEKMAIDEEIANCEKLAEINRKEYESFKRDNLNPKSCIWRAEKYEQLAEWLKELKRFKAKEAQLQNDKTKQLLDELSRMSPMVISIAYAYAVNTINYGVDVTEKWLTVIENAVALERAYNKGYYDAMQRLEESENT